MPAHGGPVQLAGEDRWLTAVADAVVTYTSRPDALASALAVAQVRLRRMDWRTGLSRPSNAYIATETGLSVRTVQRATRLLEHAGLIVEVERGSTARWRPWRNGRPDTGPNHASVHLLAVPMNVLPEDRARLAAAAARPGKRSPGQEDVNGTVAPSLSRRERSEPHTRARVDHPHTRGAQMAPDAAWSLRDVPSTKRERLNVARRLRATWPVLGKISTRHLRHLLTQAGFGDACAGDVLWALDHQPDGSQHPHSDPVRHVPGWITHRLGFWRTDHGGRHPLPGELDAAHHSAVRAEQHQRHTERAAARQVTLTEAGETAKASMRAKALSLLSPQQRLRYERQRQRRARGRRPDDHRFVPAPA